MTTKGLNRPQGEEQKPKVDFRHRPYETDELYWDRIADELLGNFDSYKMMVMENARNEIKH
jgi:hypothetical protein